MCIRDSQRISTLCTCIAANKDDPAMQYDVIALQEIFCSDTRELIEAAADQGGLAYVKHFISGTSIPHGARGSGCTILSRHRIVSTAFHRFMVNGFPENIHHWDFQAGKGIGLCRISAPSCEVDMYVTHLIGEYSEGFKDCYRAHRVLQASECAAFVNLTARTHSLVCVAGDLNALPDGPELQVLRSLAGLSDCWSCLLYTSDAADDLLCVDLGGRRIIKKKKYMIIIFITLFSCIQLAITTLHI
eukprot:TRINITY_DN6232_c0_g1_i2.p1 TRINITY_DN6232_c0_g1~~TRINITY_DN6232_c0_g1_i2.p1  ORF type:complete len:245 (+),score=59.44 TRINITY_DN6232_c0_g1_i2:135-869(+)